MSHLDISYAVGIVSQFKYVSRTGHLNTLYRILKHLKKSPRQRIPYSRNVHLIVEAYTDAYWARSKIDQQVIVL